MNEKAIHSGFREVSDALSQRTTLAAPLQAEEALVVRAAQQQNLVTLYKLLGGGSLLGEWKPDGEFAALSDSAAVRVDAAAMLQHEPTDH